MTRAIQCDCGGLKGTLSDNAVVNRCVCFCSDCQAFARFLEREERVLDDRGGTEVLQTAPANIDFTEGRERLACIRLTPRGLLRWYARCCNTPVGNTPANFKISFVGLVHNFLENGGCAPQDAFGPVRTYAHAGNARGTPKPKSAGLLAAIARGGGQVLKARLDGSYRRSPFFDGESGAPVAAPKVLDRDELAAVKAPHRA